ANGQGHVELHDVLRPSNIDQVSADRLLAALQDNLPRLVVLNSCRGATPNEYQAYHGAAQRLLREIPFVVAMQYAISDRAAIRFSSGFYGSLFAGSPLDEAVNRGRNEIFIDRYVGREFATPVFYAAGSEKPPALLTPDSVDKWRRGQRRRRR